VPLDKFDVVLDGCRRTAVRKIVVITEEGDACGRVLKRRATAVGTLCASVLPGTRVIRPGETASTSMQVREVGK
jgi:hypothetical protein